MFSLGLKCQRPLARPAPAQAQRSARRVTVCAQPGQSIDNLSTVDEDWGDNINAYCSLDKDGRRPTKELSLKEKEEMYLEAMKDFYYNRVPSLSNEEFDNLKDELLWEGSKVAVLSADEKKFLEARMAFAAGQPVMSNEEFDQLKATLAGSSIFVVDDAPACSLGNSPGKRGQKSGDAQADVLKMAALNVPPALVAASVFISANLATGGALEQIPGQVGVVFWGGLVLPTAYVLAHAFGQLLFKDALILKANCPNCGEVNTTYFGDILTVPGSREKNTLTCPCCESKLTFDAKRRQVVVEETVMA